MATRARNLQERSLVAIQGLSVHESVNAQKWLAVNVAIEAGD